jgi:uncharacterized membrane protein (DUF2068 family)
MTENANTPQVLDKPRKAPTLYFIAGIKILKGIMLILIGIAVYALAGRNLPDLFDRFLRFVHLDPEGRFFSDLSDQLATLTAANVKRAALLPFVYGFFLMIGGTGLAMRAKWAIWLAIGESAFFIPIEIYELVRQHVPNPDAPPHHMFPHPKIGMSIVLAINVLIVWYLFKNRERLFKHHN